MSYPQVPATACDVEAFNRMLTREASHVKGFCLPAEDEAKRLETVRLIVERPEEHNDPYVADVMQTCRELLAVPVAAVSILEEKFAYFRQHAGPVTAVKRNLSLCSYLLLPKEPTLIVIEDMSSDERSSQLPLVTGAPHLRFYAAVPLVASNGQALGALCMVDNRPRRFTVAECAILINLGECVSRQLEQNKYLMLQARTKAPMVRSLEGSSAALLMVDLGQPRWKVLFVNDVFVERSGLDKDDFKHGSFWDLFETHDEDEAALLARYAPLFEAGQDFSLAVRWRASKGTIPIFYISFKLASRNSGVDDEAVSVKLPEKVTAGDAMPGGPTAPPQGKLYFGTIRKVVDVDRRDPKARSYKELPLPLKPPVRISLPPEGSSSAATTPTGDSTPSRAASLNRCASDCSSISMGSPTPPNLREVLGLAAGPHRVCRHGRIKRAVGDARALRNPFAAVAEGVEGKERAT